MNDQINETLERIRKLEDELEEELEKGRALYGLKFKGKVAAFEENIVEKHRQLRMGLLQYLRESKLITFLTAPIIYSLILPLVLADLWSSLYQYICFRIYGIERVVRQDYIIIDRHPLAYLNPIEALNCAFCGYANGVIAYAREIASRTEQHWCPIKHSLRIRDPHERYLKFLEYGDAEGYRSKLAAYRQENKGV